MQFAAGRTGQDKWQDNYFLTFAPSSPCNVFPIFTSINDISTVLEGPDHLCSVLLHLEQPSTHSVVPRAVGPCFFHEDIHWLIDATESDFMALSAGAAGMKMTPEMIRAATSMMSNMRPEDMQRMASMANRSQPGASPSPPPSSSGILDTIHPGPNPCLSCALPLTFVSGRTAEYPDIYLEG